MCIIKLKISGVSFIATDCLCLDYVTAVKLNTEKIYS